MGADMSIMNSASEMPKDVARRFARLAAVKLLEDNQGPFPNANFYMSQTLCYQLKNQKLWNELDNIILW